jgi:hypothetical protein
MSPRPLSLEELIVIAKKAVLDIGLSSPGHEVDNGFAIIRLLSPNQRIIGSFTIPPHWVGMTEEKATPVIKAHALEACRAAMKEPINRA